MYVCNSVCENNYMSTSLGDVVIEKILFHLVLFSDGRVVLNFLSDRAHGH